MSNMEIEVYGRKVVLLNRSNNEKYPHIVLEIKEMNDNGLLLLREREEAKKRREEKRRKNESD